MPAVRPSPRADLSVPAGPRAGRAVRGVVVPALLLALLLGGCGGDGADDPTPPVVTTADVRTPGDSDDASDANADDANDASDEFDRLDAGRHTGLLTELGEGVLEGEQVDVVGFDKVDLLTGQEAVDAAREAGVIGPDEAGVPNDYFVRNDNPLVRQLPVRPGSEVLVLDGGSPRLVTGDLDQAVASGSLFELDVVEQDGVAVVTRVSAVYVP